MKNYIIVIPDCFYLCLTLEHPEANSSLILFCFFLHLRFCIFSGNAIKICSFFHYFKLWILILLDLK